MKKVILILSILFSISLKAEIQNLQLNNYVHFFNQSLENELTIPQSLGLKQKLAISFDIDSQDGISLKKVFSTDFVLQPNETNPDLLKAHIEIFYFNRPEGEYLSQQVFIYRNEKIIAKCTSYFPLSQDFLVPGVCSGRENQALYGIAIYK